MTVSQAMLLSSFQRAFLITWYPGIYVENKPRYRVEAARGADTSCILTVAAYRYPHKRDGKGWGEPVVQAPHLEERLSGRPALERFLADYDLPLEGWEPVEEMTENG